MDLWRSFANASQASDADSGLRLRDFLPFAQPLRRSAARCEPGTAGYLFPNSSTSQLPAAVPPAYETPNLRVHTHPSPRFNVFPREEEGHERLPAYSCSIRREAVFARKMEYRSPFERACDRAWFKVYAILDGTMLKICRVRTTALAQRSSEHEVSANPDLPVAAGAGTVLKTYTLQHAEVGDAIDYIKSVNPLFLSSVECSVTKRLHLADHVLNRRRYVIRLRVETDQFLLACNTIETFLDWLEALSAAINLALPLEERSLPRYRVIPRRYIPRLTATRQQPATQQEAITSNLSSRSPRRRAMSNLEESHGLRNVGGRSTDAQLSQSAEAERLLENIASLGFVDGIRLRGSSSAISSSGLPSSYPSVSSARTNSPAYSTSESDSPQERRQETQQNDGKWCPPHRWTMARDIWYAHRCTTVLCGDAPRQSNLIIKDGKRWKIDWAEERLIPLKEKPPRLPKYGEITKSGWVRA
ncbi:hypothetical protein GP486_006070 [Trichoglossum hirsutum]|uniref:PH domain-containing protein n=1 Tax=Trichoglossum hirsutum TaxID=265104 RepID=A0A9P8RL45_9PEZI|nr:hypothetical protein GP486_006070 [Trichoglossum hirsutum]